MDRDTLRQQVKELLSTGLRLEVRPEQISDDGAIFGEGLGLDSIDALELVVLVEEKFNIAIADEEVGRQAFASVNTLVDFITTQQAQ
jgi:acyl carrier protein